MTSSAHRNVFWPLLFGLVTLAWMALWIWQKSPHARYLNHAELGGMDLSHGIEPVVIQATLYVAGWVLMTIAMMLPTTLPLLDIFRRMTRERADHVRLVALVILGYLGAWLAFGIAAHLFDLLLHRGFDRSAWLQGNRWVFGAAPLIVAGVFQFTRLKYRCLEQCRNPLSFVLQHWRGGHPGTQAFVLGAHHGAFCVGCCWALMLLMFAVGTGNLGWMLALGAVMATEKNMPWGRRISTPLGCVLIVWGVLIALNHAASWQT